MTTYHDMPPGELDCVGHPDMALVVIMQMDGKLYLHRHVTAAAAAVRLEQLVHMLRREALAEVARADLP